MKHATLTIAIGLLLTAWGCDGGAEEKITLDSLAAEAPTTRDKDKWVEFRSPEQGFSAMFPGRPEQKTKSEPSTDAKSIEHNNYALIAKPHVYIIDIATFGFDVPETVRGNFFDVMRNANLEARGALMAEEHEISQGGLTGRERTDEQIQKDGLFVTRSRSFLAGRRFFTVSVSGFKDEIKKEEADRFLDAFRMTDAAAVPDKDKVEAAARP